MNDFLKIIDLSPSEILELIDLASDLKQKKKDGVLHKFLEGKNIALLFEKTSTRTRCAFEVAAADLGMGSTYLAEGSQFGKKESIADTARVLAGMFDAIEYRGYAQETVEKLAEYSKVPVINGLTDESHPTQILADFLTVKEHFGRLKGIKFVYMGDARFNMGNSLMVGAAKVGMDFVACAPKEFFPSAELVKKCESFAAESGGSVTLSENVDEAVRGADVIYTDIWVSMGEPESVWEERINKLLPYQVNAAVMERAGEQCRFMHCLPSYHDLNTEVGKAVGEKFGLSALEVTDDVFESERSIVFDEAENRLHTIKAVIYKLLA